MSTWKAKFEKRQQDQKDAVVAKKVEVNEISFPSLSTESAWGAPAGAGRSKAVVEPEAPKKSFASLAAEWKDTEEMLRIQQKINAERMMQERQERESSGGRGSLFYNFGETHSRMEDTYYEDEYAADYVPTPTADTSDDWRTCEKKVRRAPKTAVQRIMEDELNKPSTDDVFWHEQHQDDTVWSKYS
jgi:hypothetical protein